MEVIIAVESGVSGKGTVMKGWMGRLEVQQNRLERGRISYFFIICVIWFALFAMLASINYTIYSILPTWYEIEPEGLSFLEVAFEFIHYTFSLMITYSSDSIAVNCIGSKVVKIVECLFFYIVVGNLINQLINGATEVAKAPSSEAGITEE